MTVVFEGGAEPYREGWRTIEDRFLIFRLPPAEAATLTKDPPEEL